ncbi:MAG: bifunctional riboflavin kinase/FAD synthetase, partial [Candidatus Binatia bacterium]
HLGHKALLRRVVDEAKKLGGRSVVLTFEPHPLKVLAPSRAPRLILNHKDKILLLRDCGADVVIMQNFDAEFAHIEAKNFVDQFLVGRLGVRQVWVGKDFAFGRDKKGRVQQLVQWGAANGFEVGVMDPVIVDGERVSSSRIRQLIEAGDVGKANRLLGRSHFLSGRVATGHQRGRALGFPTANIVSRTEMIPASGIYATLLEVHKRQWSSVTSIGYNPTFGPGPKTIESHVLDFSDNLYGQTVRLHFAARIREERKFSSAELLVAQMQKDVVAAQEILAAGEALEAVGTAD